MLSVTPPIISVNQCTPEIRRAISIKIVKAVAASEIILLLEFLCSLNIKAGITVRTNKVVDEGYDASHIPFISIGR